MSRLRVLALGLVLPLALPLQFSCYAQKTTKPPKEETCSVSGIVMKMADSAPLRKARVVLKSVDDPNRTVAAVTNADGHFMMKGVEPGAYRLTVTRVGFVADEYGRRKPDTPGAVLTLHAGQDLKDLQFRLIPAGVISGKIYDDDGEPLPGVQVNAVRQVYSEGKRSRTSATTASTNDLGEYRLYGLAPGRYFVSCVYPRWNRGGSEDDVTEVEKEGYAKLFYPGTADPAKAGVITIKAGEEASSIEILMRKVPVHQVRGNVYNQITHKPGAGVMLLLLPKTSSREWDYPASVGVQKSDGSFVIQEVLPGSYTLVSLWFDEDITYVNRQAIDVGDADVEGIAMIVAPGSNINGRVLWEGQPALEKDELTLTPQPVDLSFGMRGQSRVGRDNLFTLKGLGEGTYRAEVTGMSKDCYIKDMHYGESSVLKDGFTVTRSEAGALEILISSRGARVQGTVTDSDGLPLPGASIVLVPDLSQRENYQKYKSQSTDQYGKFDLRGIASGDYKLFSWVEVETDAWQDAEFLKEFEEKGQRITVQDGDRKEVKVTAIQAKAADNSKP
jgi:protocatechuate 3,4-dioxygenase beta subunit